MRSTQNTRSAIRLDERPRPDARGERVYRQAVAHEMLSARESARSRALDPDFDPTDARWHLALETQRALQGAMLAFEDRRRLLSLAQKVGIRPFDANLIIALVQDRVRRGEPIEHAAPAIAIVPAAAVKTAAARPPALRGANLPHLLVAAVILAMAADAALIAWLMFGR